LGLIGQIALLGSYPHQPFIDTLITIDSMGVTLTHTSSRAAVDEVHLLGEDRGAALEAVVSRMRAVR
jgi:hypothetical protein